MKPYTIFLPDWDTTSGGIRVMWGLYGALLLKGQVVIPNAKIKDAIAIYPEIVNGNPLGADHVVRYILNDPGVMASMGVAGPTEFDETDKLYVFSEMFNSKIKADGKHKLFLPILDTFTFKDHKKIRTKNAVFFGKGGDKGLHPPDCIKIDRTIAQDQQGLADFFNECQVLYSYDPISAMGEIARLCGCKVTLLQDKYSKSQYREYEPGINGVSFGMDEDVPLESAGFRAHYSWMKREFLFRLNGFIEDTQKL